MKNIYLYICAVFMCFYLCPLLQQPLLERFLNRAAEGFQNLFTAVEDHFELCLAKCRTSSQVCYDVMSSTLTPVSNSVLIQKLLLCMTTNGLTVTQPQL